MASRTPTGLTGRRILVAGGSSGIGLICAERIGAAGARGLKAAAIGPITAETARAAGLEVVVQPGEYTVPALVTAIHNYFVSSDK